MENTGLKRASQKTEAVKEKLNEKMQTQVI